MGTPASLHLDAWGVLNYAYGHRIIVSNTPPKASSKQLYSVNLGGYSHHQFTELHQNIFVIVTNEQEAKQKAVLQINDWESPHRDYLYQADSLLNLHTIT